jgi:hypothetical protein
MHQLFGHTAQALANLQAGTLKGDILSLTSPDQDGKISTVEYKACNIANFNQALETFKKKYGAGK